MIPRAALLGSLAAIALALISFLPFVELFSQPVIGLVSLGIILASLTAKVPIPWRIPGALAALLAGGSIAAVGHSIGWLFQVNLMQVLTLSQHCGQLAGWTSFNSHGSQHGL